MKARPLAHFAIFQIKVAMRIGGGMVALISPPMLRTSFAVL
jgi:hypothetical protein